MASSRTYAWIVGVFILFLGIYATASLTLPVGQSLSTFGNIAPVPGASTGKCGAVAECRNSTLAPQHVLDASRFVLHPVDDRPVSMDILRSYLHRPLPDMWPGGHHFLLVPVFP